MKDQKQKAKILLGAVILLALSAPMTPLTAQQAVVLTACGYYSMDRTTGEAESDCSANYGPQPSTAVGAYNGLYGSSMPYVRPAPTFNWDHVDTCFAIVCGAATGTAIIGMAATSGAVSPFALPLVTACTGAIVTCAGAEFLRTSPDFHRLGGDDGQFGGSANCMPASNIFETLNAPQVCSAFNNWE